MRAWILRFHVLLVLLALSAGVQASYHLWTITQLYSNADGSVQFIELQALAGGEEFLAGHTIVSAQGGSSHSFMFPANLPGDTATTMTEGGGYYGGGSMTTTYRTMLIATQGFAALNGVRPDYVVPNGFLFTSGGTLTYGEGADVMTYGALPTDGKMALYRNGMPGVNLPQNFAGDAASITQTATAEAPGPLSGLWWNASESGWGVDFTQRRNVIFVAWYTYDASGNPKWYVASNCTMPVAGATSGTCNGSLYEVDGPTFFGTAFNPAMESVTTAGSMSVVFQDANDAMLTYTLGGQSRTVAITRQPISSGPTPGVDYTDLWWNPSESGWGLAVTQQGSVMFLAWYVYNGSGKPMWYVAPDCVVSGSACTGTLYSTTGPALGTAFDPTKVQATMAGTVTLMFSDANNGTLSYTVNGASASKPITRQVF
ncbi:MAG TPA: hypothetical protein VN782_04560 [Usitatibacter sp.]|nr:hypothetical protein [Usitatibacter sp.]